MPKVTIDDLRKIRDKVSKEISLRHGESDTQIIVHMGTCGIAAGARDVMKALLAEMAESDREDIRVIASGCTGTCTDEPNVTVEIRDREPVVYKKMDPEKVGQMFRGHILGGEVQEQLT